MILPELDTALLTIDHASFWANAVASVLEYTGVIWGKSVARIPATVTLCVYGAALPDQLAEMVAVFVNRFPST